MRLDLKAGLLAGVSLLVSGGALAQDVSGPADDDSVRDVIIVIGQGRTFSSSESSETMALQQAPVTSILSIIDNLPGVQVQEGDTFGFDDWATSVSVRGFQNNLAEQQVGITIDGLPNGGSNYGGGSKANRYIDSQNAAGVEVSQGTADIATRSNEALGGTLNFTTQDPELDRRVRVSMTLGDFDAQRLYGRYDTGGFWDDTTRAWVSLSTQSATDHIEGSAKNRRDHFAAKLTSTLFDVNWTAYASFDDAHENNYDQLYSAADFTADPDSDRLIGNWTDVPYVNQSYRGVWATLRENFFTYLKADKEFDNGLRLEGGLYRHDMNGRGDWAPYYLVDVVDDAGGPESEYMPGFRATGGGSLGLIYFVDPDGVALSPTPGCVGSLDFPYGGSDDPALDPACYPANAIPVQSYRHTHYNRDRYGATADFAWDMSLGEGIDNTLRGGIWYEDGARYEYRDWHKLTDARVGPDYDGYAYWVQYNRAFPQNTFKWYVEDVLTIGDFTIRGGLKQFNNEIERVDRFNPGDPDDNFTLDSESDVLLSGGLSWSPGAIDGLEMFAGYAENYKAIPDGVLEVISGDGVPDPETSETIEVGLRYVGDRFRASAVYFDNKFDNRLFPVPTFDPGDAPDYLEASNGGYLNGGGVDSSGFELAGTFQLNDNWSFYGSYTWIDASILGTGDAQLDADAGIAVGNAVPGIPENMYVVSADYIEGNFYGGLSVKWLDDRYVNLANTWIAESYYEADLYVGVMGEAISDDLSGVDFRLTINNLLDDDWLSGISGNAAWISPPRTFALTVTADF